jgi:hypothetical protein
VLSCKKKARLPLCLINWAVWLEGRGEVSPWIWHGSDQSTSRPATPRGKSPYYPLNIRLDIPHNQCGHCRDHPSRLSAVTSKHCCHATELCSAFLVSRNVEETGADVHSRNYEPLTEHGTNGPGGGVFCGRELTATGYRMIKNKYASQSMDTNDDESSQPLLPRWSVELIRYKRGHESGREV